MVAMKVGVDIRENELSTRNMLRKEGTAADSSIFLSKSGAMAFNKLMFSLGFLKGRFVSVDIIRCAASR